MLEAPGHVSAWADNLHVNVLGYTNRSLLQSSFLKVFTLDEVDYDRDFFSGSSMPLQVPLDFPLQLIYTMPLCQVGQIIGSNPYWQNLTYDPSLTALYDDPTTNAQPDSGGTPCNQCVNKIVIGSVFGAVLLIVIVLLVFSLNPKARACMRPYSTRTGVVA